MHPYAFSENNSPYANVIIFEADIARRNLMEWNGFQAKICLLVVFTFECMRVVPSGVCVYIIYLLNTYIWLVFLILVSSYKSSLIYKYEVYLFIYWTTNIWHVCSTWKSAYKPALSMYRNKIAQRIFTTPEKYSWELHTKRACNGNRSHNLLHSQGISCVVP